MPIAGAAPKIFAEADEEQRAMPHLWAVHDAQAGTLVGFAMMISDNIPHRSTTTSSARTTCGSYSSITGASAVATARRRWMRS